LFERTFGSAIVFVLYSVRLIRIDFLWENFRKQFWRREKNIWIRTKVFSWSPRRIFLQPRSRFSPKLGGRFCWRSVVELGNLVPAKVVQFTSSW